MKAVLLNGSPKRKDSASACLLACLKACLPESVSTVELSLSRPVLPEAAFDQLEGAEAWVFAFPLYADGVPSHLLSCLLQLEALPLCRGKKIFALVNCGFYEGSQTEPALEVLQNWCGKAGAHWQGGVGTGGGGSLVMLLKPPWGRGPCASIHRALTALAKVMAQGQAMENSFVTVDLPRFLYRLAGQLGWRQMIKANGGQGKDLNRQMD